MYSMDNFIFNSDELKNLLEDVILKRRGIRQQPKPEPKKAIQHPKVTPQVKERPLEELYTELGKILDEIRRRDKSENIQRIFEKSRPNASFVDVEEPSSEIITKSAKPKSIIRFLDNGDINDLFKNLPRKPTVEDNPPNETEVAKVEAIHPFVFISNRLTFLIKCRYPVVFDTSSIKAKGEDKVFVAFDKNDNPKLDIREATRIANDINFNEEIQEEVKEFLDDTKWDDIVCSPSITWVNKEARLGFMFTLIEK